ncbi:hypothetical protein D3C73_1319720 [compost metagenome]
MRLVVIQGNQQPQGVLGQNTLEVGGISFTHGRWQGNQRRPVVQPGTVGHIAGCQFENITTPQLDRPGAIDLEGPLHTDVRVKLMFLEEVLNGLFRQFDSQNFVPLERKPQ